MMAETKKQIVLGVDDDSRVREAIESLLDMAGYEALVFSSADELLRSPALAPADLCNNRRPYAWNGWNRITAPP
jgi:FixJ family two-component response regulator